MLRDILLVGSGFIIGVAAILGYIAYQIWRKPSMYF